MFYMFYIHQHQHLKFLEFLAPKCERFHFPTIGLSARTVPPMMPESPPTAKATLSVLRIAVSRDKTLSVLQVTEGDWRDRAWTPLPPSPS